jgi:hypothetical protein
MHDDLDSHQELPPRSRTPARHSRTSKPPASRRHPWRERTRRSGGVVAADVAGEPAFLSFRTRTPARGSGQGSHSTAQTGASRQQLDEVRGNKCGRPAEADDVREPSISGGPADRHPLGSPRYGRFRALPHQLEATHSSLPATGRRGLHRHRRWGGVMSSRYGTTLMSGASAATRFASSSRHSSTVVDSLALVDGRSGGSIQ